MVMIIYVCMYVCMIYVCMYVRRRMYTRIRNELHIQHSNITFTYTIHIIIHSLTWLSVSKRSSFLLRVWLLWLGEEIHMVTSIWEQKTWKYEHTSVLVFEFECVNIWVYEYMGIWVYEYISIWGYEYIDIWVYEYISVWVYEYECMSVWEKYTSTWVHEYMSTWVYEYMSIWVMSIWYEYNLSSQQQPNA